MSKRKLFCDSAVKYENVRWGHIGRNTQKIKILKEEDKKRINLDCAGLCVESANDAGLEVEDIDFYNRIPDGSSLVAHLNKIADLKEKKDVLPGDILLMGFGGLPTHLAIYLGDYYNNGINYFIHSSLPDRRVLIQRFDDRFFEATYLVYSLKNIDSV